jgi:hypothetical protein
MTTDITAENQYWVHIRIEGGELEPHGPYSADEAEAVAIRLAGICRVLHQSAVTRVIATPAVKRSRSRRFG